MSTPVTNPHIVRVAQARGPRILGRHQHWIVLVLLSMSTGVTPAAAQGRLLEKCARGQLEVCFAILSRPRLEPGRRAAIEFHLAEVDKLWVACSAGEQPACATLADRYPDLPPDLAARAKAPVR